MVYYVCGHYYIGGRYNPLKGSLIGCLSFNHFNVLWNVFDPLKGSLIGCLSFNHFKVLWNVFDPLKDSLIGCLAFDTCL